MKKLLPFTIILLLFAACEQGPEFQVSTGYTQGTTYTVKYSGVKRDMSYQIDSTLLVFDRQLSTYIASSYITKWNENRTKAEAPEYFTSVVNAGIDLHGRTNGAFDMTIGPLFNLWKLDDDGYVPDSAEVDSVMEFVGSGKLSFNENKFSKTDDRVQLDVNAIAQGYAVDVLADMLEVYRATDYLVEIGGEIRVKGNNPDGNPWRLAIDSPNDGDEKRGSAVQLNLSSGALATSGNYRHFIEAGGKQYGHIIDPRTGYPAETDVLSASVIANDCMTADALATAIMVGGSTFGKDLIMGDSDLEGVIITGRDGKLETWVSDGVK